MAVEDKENIEEIYKTDSSENLQKDHTSTGDNSGGQVSTELPDTDTDGTRGDHVSSTLRAGGGGRAGSRNLVSVASGRGGDGTSTSGTSLLEESRAGTAGGAGGLGGGSTVEVASGSAVALGLLLLVVHVHGVGELLLGGANTVGTVVTSGGVGGDTVTDVIATDGTENLTDLLAVQLALDSALQAVHHAGAEVLVGRRRERSGSSTPGAVDSGARLESRVGRLVVALLGTGSLDLGELRGEVVEVVEGADLVSINGDETYSCQFSITCLPWEMGEDIP